MRPDELAERLRHERAVAILRWHEQEIAAAAMAAAVDGGFRAVELTLSIPGVFELLTDFARDPRLVVGAGTVLTPHEAERAVAAGARFLVSPVFDPAVVAAAAALGVAVLPGTHTPSEMLAAHRAGATLVKLFPAPASGPVWLRAVLAPLPFLKVVPTHGVDAGNAASWLVAGAWAVGFTTPLFTPALLAARAFGAITQQAGRCLAAVAAPAGEPLG